MSGGALRIEALTVNLGGFHLRELTLEVAAGEYLVIVGPTGAGKTVRLETLAGLRRPQAGRLYLDGVEITATPPERRGIGFVYQDYALFPHLTVAENIAFGLRLLGRRGQCPRPTQHCPRPLRRPEVAALGSRPTQERLEQRVAALAEMLGLERLLDRRPATLSGGEAQRVALARALAVEPRLLLLDEPLSSLEPSTRAALREELARLHRTLGTTTIHVTHDFEEAFTLGGRIAVIHHGRLLQVGSPEEVFRHPRDETVARFVGMGNIFPGAPLDGERFRLQAGPVLLTAEERAGAGHAAVRPEEILLSRQPPEAENRLQGRLVALEDRGAILRLRVEVPPAFEVWMTRRAFERLAPRLGERLWVSFPASAVHLF